MNRRIRTKYQRIAAASALILTLSIGGQNGLVSRVSGNDLGLTLKEKAFWSDPDRYEGELLLEVGGLKSAREKLLHPEQESEPETLSGMDIKEPAAEDTEENELSAALEETVKEESREPEAGETEGENDIPDPAGENVLTDSPMDHTEIESQNTASSENRAPENEAQENEEPGDEESEKVISEETLQDTASAETANRLFPLVTSVRADASSEEGNLSVNPQRLRLILELSEYFSLDKETLPEYVRTKKVRVLDHSGNETETERIIADIPQELDTDPLYLRIPVRLKEAYRSSAAGQRFPVAEVFYKGDKGKLFSQTARLVAIEAENSSITDPTRSDETAELTDPAAPAISADPEERIVLTSADPAYLQILPREETLRMYVHADQTEVKAGKTVTFTVELENAGETALEKLRLQSTLSREGFYAVWKPAEGLSITGTDGIARLEKLPPGEQRQLTLTIKIPEDQTDPVEHTIQVSAQDPLSDGAMLQCGHTLCTTVLPLSLDFQVEKTADRRAAVPGDTVSYRIVITNTGERTLHSVMSTERFQLADVSAQFVKKEGVLINKDGTQAYISKIDPGKAAELEAIVKIPASVSAQKLVNQVLVTTRETGAAENLSEATVEITEPEKEEKEETGGGGSQSVSAYPQTGDNSPLERLLCLAAASGTLMICLYILLRRTRKK